jgi:hypothetical protein
VFLSHRKGVSFKYSLAAKDCVLPSDTVSITLGANLVPKEARNTK